MTSFKDLHPRNDDDRLYVTRRKGGRGLTSIDDNVNTPILLGDYIEKHEGGLITATRNNTTDTRTSGTTATRK